MEHACCRPDAFRSRFILQLRLGKLDEAERQCFAKRIASWILAQKQLEVFVGLYHREAVMGAAFVQPETEELSYGPLKRRGVAIEDATPTFVGETLSSSEIARVMLGWLVTVSATERDEQTRYYRSRYDKLDYLARNSLGSGS